MTTTKRAPPALPTCPRILLDRFRITFYVDGAKTIWLNPAMDEKFRFNKDFITKVDGTDHFTFKFDKEGYNGHNYCIGWVNLVKNLSFKLYCNFNVLFMEEFDVQQDKKKYLWDTNMLPKDTLKQLRHNPALIKTKNYLWSWQQVYAWQVNQAMQMIESFRHWYWVWLNKNTLETIKLQDIKFNISQAEVCFDYNGIHYECDNVFERLTTKDVRYYGNDTQYRKYIIEQIADGQTAKEERFKIMNGELFSKEARVMRNVYLVFYQKMLDQFRWELHYNAEDRINNIFCNPTNFDYFNNRYRKVHTVLAQALKEHSLNLCKDINFSPLTLSSLPRENKPEMKHYYHFANIMKIDPKIILQIIFSTQLSQTIRMLTPYQRKRLSHDLKLIEYVNCPKDKNTGKKAAVYILTPFAEFLKTQFFNGLKSYFKDGTTINSVLPVDLLRQFEHILREINIQAPTKEFRDVVSSIIKKTT